MNNNLINETIEYVKDFFKNEFSGHDFWHTLRVYNMAKTIAEKEECDKEIVCLAALLHDVDDVKLVGEQEIPYNNAITYLRSKDYDEERIQKIVHIISQVSYRGGSTKPDTIEGEITQDADRLDAIGAIGIARTFAFGGNKNREMYNPDTPYVEGAEMQGDKYVGGPTINHFYEKLLKLKDLLNTNSAKEIAEHRHKYMEEFLDEFYAEWDGEK